MEGEASYNWPTTAILTPFAAGFALIAALLTLWAVVKPRTLKGNSENCLLVSIGTLFSLLSWVKYFLIYFILRFHTQYTNV